MCRGCGYEATNLVGRRRTSITVHPQSSVCASARSGYERYSIHAPREVTDVKELVLRFLRSGGQWGMGVSTCSAFSLPHTHTSDFIALPSLSTPTPHPHELGTSTRAVCKFSAKFLHSPQRFSAILHNYPPPFSTATLLPSFKNGLSTLARPRRLFLDTHRLRGCRMGEPGSS